MEESKKDEARLICDWWMDFPDDIIALAIRLQYDFGRVFLEVTGDDDVAILVSEKGAAGDPWQRDLVNPTRDTLLPYFMGLAIRAHIEETEALMSKI